MVLLSIIEVDLQNATFNRVGYVNSKIKLFIECFINKENTSARLYDLDLNGYHLFKVNQIENSNFIFIDTMPIKEKFGNEVMPYLLESIFTEDK